jgi:hypothetical protein
MPMVKVLTQHEDSPINLDGYAIPSLDGEELGRQPRYDKRSVTKIMTDGDCETTAVWHPNPKPVKSQYEA